VAQYPTDLNGWDIALHDVQIGSADGRLGNPDNGIGGSRNGGVGLVL
jgi:hypothetical protein